MISRSHYFYSGVFLISGLVMMLQILQSRIFSVTSWYHLSFLVISVAMFGLTLGALKVYRGIEAEQRKNYGLLARDHCFWFGIFVIVSLLIQLFIPIISNEMSSTFLSLPFVAIANSLAYYHAGVVITLCLTRAPYPVGKTYGIDLLGAGLGCIAALGLMETIDAPSAVLIVSGLGFFCGFLFVWCDESAEKQHINILQKKRNFSKIASSFFVFTIVISLANIFSPRPMLYPIWIKNTFVPQSVISFEDWNSISRVTLYKEYEDVTPFLWGPSPKTPTDYRVNSYMLTIDGDAGTPLTQFDGDFEKHGYLEYDATNIAYHLPNLKSAAIIGVGGGRDLLSAKYFGVEEVTALDVNPVQIHLLTEHPHYSTYTGLSTLPGVTILNEEARSWFRQNDRKLDLIQMSLIDTWAATGAGAFALSENGLYTVDAWTIFMNDLSENGVFTLSRWSSNVIDDAGRALAVAMATLFNQGVTDVSQHIAIINSQGSATKHHGNIATLIVAKSPFTAEQITALRAAANEKAFKITLLPGEPKPSGILGELIEAKNIQELHTISDRQFFDVSPSTDMRPFFFNQARIGEPLKVTKLAVQPLTEGHFVSQGQAKATFNLYIIIVFSFLMVALVIIVPLSKTVENKGSTFIRAGTLYFMLIGLGFMFIEISLLQALGVFLGHPIYGLSVVLFSIIISAGLGSLTSEKLPLDNFGRQSLWALLVFSYAVIMAMILGDLFISYAESDISTRVALSVAIMFPAGFLMGFGFPTGLSITQKYDTRATSWFWGINGAAGVLGSSIAIAFNIAVGIDQTLIIGGVCYALLIVSFMLLREPEAEKVAQR